VKILLDENCQGLRNYLLEMKWDVYSVTDVLNKKEGENSINDNAIMQYAKENKLIIVTKDKGLKIQCYNELLPFIKLGSPKEEAETVDKKLKEMLVWKEYF
jgi:predicted nuclease of predicted toxin-antitoxin system